MIGAGIAFALALGITVYPLISTWYNDRHQSKIHTQYMEIVEQTDDSQLRKAWNLAQRYNAAIVPGAKVDASFTREAIQAASENYDSQLNLAGDGIMGYVEIPMIQVLLPIYHGTDAASLNAGIGHLLGTSLPVGGKNTHSVLTAHSGVASQKLFSDLDQLKEGDIFYLKVLGVALAYQVDQIHTVLPHDTTYLGITEGEDRCTLVTCTPFGVNTHRLLVQGTRISYEEAEQVVEQQILEEVPKASTWVHQYVLGIAYGIGIVAIAGGILLVVQLKRRRDNA